MRARRTSRRRWRYLLLPTGGLVCGLLVMGVLYHADLVMMLTRGKGLWEIPADRSILLILLIRIVLVAVIGAVIGYLTACVSAASEISVRLPEAAQDERPPRRENVPMRGQSFLWAPNAPATVSERPNLPVQTTPLGNGSWGSRMSVWDGLREATVCTFDVIGATAHRDMLIYVRQWKTILTSLVMPATYILVALLGSIAVGRNPVALVVQDRGAEASQVAQAVVSSDVFQIGRAHV